MQFVHVKNINEDKKIKFILPLSEMENFNMRGEIISLLEDAPNLTNQQIRKRLHEKKFQLTKTELNTTLHQLSREKTLVYEIKGENKFWKIHQELPTTKVKKEVVVEMEQRDREYKALLEKVKKQAAIWKESNPANTFPKRKDKIANFVENSLVTGLSPELYTKIAQDLFLYGW